MATYTKTDKKCPHCGNVYRSYPGREECIYGCPLILCKHCNQYFWDNEIKEPALYGYDNDYERKNNIRLTIFLLLMTCAAIGCLCSGIYIVVNGEEGSFTPFLLAGLFSILPILFFIIHIYERKNPEKAVAFIQKSYDLSKERLQNTVYLTALAEHDPLAKELLHERISHKPETYAARPEAKVRIKKVKSKKEKKPVTSVLQKNNLTKIRKSPKVESQEELLNTIEKMKKMYDDGILSKEEFETKKTEFLARL